MSAAPTLPAYYLIAQNGYRWGEVDLFPAKDNTPMLSHNATITGTLNGVSTTLTLSESTEAELKQLVLSNHATYGEIHPASLADLLELAKTINIGLVLDMQSLLTGSNTVGYDFQGGVSDECIEIVHNAGLSVSFWGISDTGHFRHNPLRVTYSGYGYAHLGRDYIRQKQADLAAKYPTG